ncbi:MAG: PilZ domain-containing protein [Proteobacteria bacterium]|nr:PilZ domain-containing protein [Pseudomonadota bacterium]
MKGHPGADRRSHERAKLTASALLFRDEVLLGRYVAVNLSAAGALLRGDLRPSGGPVRVVLLLPDDEILSLKGRVVRRPRAERRGSSSVAVRFEHDSPASEDKLQEIVLQALSRGDRVIDLSGPLGQIAG